MITIVIIIVCSEPLVIITIVSLPDDLIRQRNEAIMVAAQLLNSRHISVASLDSRYQAFYVTTQLLPSQDTGVCEQTLLRRRRHVGR